MSKSPTPRATKRKARVWKAWGYTLVNTGNPLVVQGKAYALGKSRKEVEDAAGGFAT